MMKNLTLTLALTMMSLTASAQYNAAAGWMAAFDLSQELHWDHQEMDEAVQVAGLTVQKGDLLTLGSPAEKRFATLFNDGLGFDSDPHLKAKHSNKSVKVVRVWVSTSSETGEVRVSAVLKSWANGWTVVDLEKAVELGEVVQATPGA